MALTRSKVGYLIAALTLLNILNFADRYLVLSFSNEIIRDLELTKLDFGLLIGVGFTAIYTVVGLLAGSLADRYDRSTVIAAGVFLWSTATAVTGVARSFGEVVGARMLVGVGEGCLTPAAVAMLGDAVKPSRRALVSGIYYLGVPIGIGGSFILAAAIGPALGWRGAFIAMGAIGLLAAILVFLLMSDPPREPSAKASLQRHQTGERLTQRRKEELRAHLRSALGAAAVPPPRSLSDTLRTLRDELRHNRAFAYTLLGATAFSFVSAGGVLDLVWWVNERGYTEGVAQRTTGGLFLLGGTLGALLGGWLADLAYLKVSAGRLKFLAWASVASIPILLGYRLVPGQTTAFVSFAFGGAVLSMLMFGPLFAVVQELVPATHRAAAVALFLFCASLIGIGVGNGVVGYLADTFTTRGLEQPITAATLCMASGLLVSIPAFFLAARHQARMTTPDTAGEEATAFSAS